MGIEEQTLVTGQVLGMELEVYDIINSSIQTQVGNPRVNPPLNGIGRVVTSNTGPSNILAVSVL